MGQKDTNPTRRHRPSRDKKPVIYIFCEGEKTEPTYFKGWRERGMSLQIIPVSHTDPVGIVKDVKRKMADRSFEPEQGDSVWCVYDVDDNSDGVLQKADKQAKVNQYRVVVSNPCFEIWYILHFEAISSQLTSTEAQMRLLKHIPDYCKNIDVFDKLEPLIGTANQNAIRLQAKYSEKGDPVAERACNPFTNAYELVQKLTEIRQKARRRG